MEACFADVVNTDLMEEPTEDLQVSGYTMLSRARYLNRLWILQPFSPRLFAQAALCGQDILLRKLLGKITLPKPWKKCEKHKWNSENKRSKKEEAKKLSDIFTIVPNVYSLEVATSENKHMLSEPLSQGK